MRIAWFSDTFEQNNGVATYIKQILPLLAEKTRVTLYTGRVKGKYKFKIEPQKHINYPILPDYDIIIPPNKPPAADVVHAHSPFTLGLYASNLPLPKVVTAHFLPYHFIEWAFGAQQPEGVVQSVWKYESWFLNRFDHVICQTRAGAKLFKKNGVTKPIGLIPNGMRLDEFKHVTPELFRKKYKAKEPFALFVGRLDASKQPEWILQIAKTMPKKRFVIIGKGTMEAQIRAKAQPNVTILGRLQRKEVLSAFKAATVTLMPSKVETEGLVAQESLACGTPVLYAPLDILKEVVGAGGSECRTPAAMADKTAAFFEDNALRERASKNALRHIRSRDIDSSLQKLMTLYEKLAA